MSETFVERHRQTLSRALEAIRERRHWTPYPENAREYGDSAAADGQARFEGYLGRPFPLQQAGADGRQVGEERSPYGIPLDVSYPHVDIEALLPAMTAALPEWRDAGPEIRAGVCLEILHRLNARSFEVGHAVMHTTGQAFGMAFQAGGPHAQDRALEAIAYAYAEMTRHAPEAVWEKPQGKRPPLRMAKRFTPVPRGIGLVIGCNTFPTWNGYPGLFASLVTGNPVVVKPHRRAVLPLAITVVIGREVLAEAGFSPDLLTLVAESADERLAPVLATRPEVRLVDYTGSTEFGEWLEEKARQANVYAEKAGVNTVVIDSTDDYKGMLGNLAFSVSLYSGQMCTTPQNLLVPRGGITTDQGPKSYDEVSADLARASEGLLGDPGRAVAVLGGIVNDGVLERITRAASMGEVALASRAVTHPEFPDAVVRTPVLVRLDVADEKVYLDEHFGPIAFVVATDNTAESLALLRRTVRDHGALTASVYSTSEDVLAEAEEIALDTHVALSRNLTDGVYVNQSAAFSDFHATGDNPAANAALTDGAFVASRLVWVQSRRHLPAESAG